MIFYSNECLVIDKQKLNLDKDNLIYKLKACRNENLYSLELNPGIKERCFISNDENCWLWHKRLAHVNFTQLEKLIKGDLVIGIPSFKFKHDTICEACQK